MTAPLCALPPEARLTAHLASQLASAPGTTLASPRDDFSHTALYWNREQRALTGAAVTGASRRSALVPETLELLVTDTTGKVEPSKLALADHTMDQAITWLSRELGAPLKMPAHDLPDHPTLRGEPFEQVDGLPQVSAWLEFGHESLGSFVTDFEDASRLTLWPHHFDLATLIAVGRAPTGETQTIGLGLSLGDGAYTQPYFYVSPWPYPETDKLPPLERGTWHTDGFTAAILEGTSLTTSPYASAQSSAVAFLREAAAAAQASLGSRTS